MKQARKDQANQESQAATAIDDAAAAAAEQEAEFAAHPGNIALVDEGVEYQISQHNKPFGRRAGEMPALDVPDFMVASLAAAVATTLQSVNDPVVVVAPELQPPVEGAENVLPQPPVDRALARLLGDIGQLSFLASSLTERLAPLLPAEVVPAARAEDRVRHGDSRYVVAIDNASERVSDIANKLSAMLATLEG